MQQEYLILEEAQVKELLTADLAIQAIKDCFTEKAAGTFNALAKVSINGQNGSLRITPGESQEKHQVIGFRLYDVIRSDFSEQPQLIVVYDNQNGRLKGIIISQLLGAYRTAAINAVMHNHVKKSQVNTLGIIGTGFQARIHLALFDHLLQPKEILVYGRTPANVQQFINDMNSQLNRSVPLKSVGSIDDLVGVDSLLLTTRSQTPLITPHQFPQGITVTTIGPKGKGKSEVSEAFADACDVVITDAIEQVEKYGDYFFISNRSRIHDFTAVLNHAELGRQSDDQRILLCSVGMGGTEVVLGNALIEQYKKQV